MFFIAVLLFAGVANAAPLRRSCTGDELLGGNACAAAQLDTIVSTAISTASDTLQSDMESLTATVAQRLNETIDTTTSTFKAFANTSADVNLSQAGSMAADSWTSMETALSAEQSKSASLEAQASDLNQAIGQVNVARDQLEASFLSLEQMILTQNSAAAAERAALSSELSASESNSIYRADSLDARIAYTLRCVHGDVEYPESGGYSCHCHHNYSGAHCDEAHYITCSSEDDIGWINAAVDAVYSINVLVINENCPSHLIDFPISLHHINHLALSACSTLNLDNYAVVRNLGHVNIDGCFYLNDVSGFSNLRSITVLKMWATLAPHLEMTALTAPFEIIQLADHLNMTYIHIDGTDNVSDTAVIDVANCPLVTEMSGFTHNTKITSFLMSNFTSLRTLNILPSLTYIGNESDSSGALLLEGVPRLSEGTFLSNTGANGLSGIVLWVNITSLSKWVMDRAQPPGAYPLWHQHTLRINCYHGNEVSANSPTDDFSCTCNTNYSGADCATTNVSYTYDFWHDIIDPQVTVDAFYNDLIGVRHIEGTLELNELYELTNPLVQDVLYNIETVGNLSLDHPFIYPNRSHFLPEGMSSLMPALQSVDTLTLRRCDDLDGALGDYFPQLHAVQTLETSRLGMHSLATGVPIAYDNVLLDWTDDSQPTPLDFHASFSHLTTLNSLSIAGAPGLYGLSAFGQVHSMSGDLTVTENSDLPFFDGLWGLTWVGGDVRIYNNTNMMGPITPISYGGSVGWFFTERNGPCGVPDWGAVC